MTKEKPEEKKIIVIDQKELEEFDRMLQKLKAEASQPDPAVVKRAIIDTNGGKIDPEKRYVVLDTGRFREWEKMFLKISTIAEPEKPAAPNVPYLATIIIMVAVGILGVLGFLSIRPDENILVVAGIMFAIITPVTTSIMTLMQSRDTHKAVNSRLDAFIEQAASSARAEGMEAGREKADLRTDELKAAEIKPE